MMNERYINWNDAYDYEPEIRESGEWNEDLGPCDSLEDDEERLADEI